MESSAAVSISMTHITLGFVTGLAYGGFINFFSEKKKLDNLNGMIEMQRSEIYELQQENRILTQKVKSITDLSERLVGVLSGNYDLPPPLHMGRTETYFDESSDVESEACVSTPDNMD
jgi:hypothetical protein